MATNPFVMVPVIEDSLKETPTLQEFIRYVVLDIVARSAELYLGILWGPAMLVVSIARLAITMVYNFLLVRKSKGNKLIWGIVFVGGLMNTIAILANGFRMPVFRRERMPYVGIHKAGKPDAKLKFLCDIYQGGFGSVFSLGDALIFTGEIVLIVKGLVEEFERILQWS